MIGEMVQLARGALFLDTSAFVGQREARDAFKKGVILIVVVTLLAGSLPFLVSAVKGFLPGRLAAEQQNVQKQVRQILKVFPFEFDPETERMIVGSIEAGIDMGFKIAALPTPLPQPIGHFLQALGRWLTSPLARLGGWMSYAFVVLLVAKLLGGRATLAQMLGCTSLYVVPHLLSILSFVPCLGAVLGLVAFVWGVAVYVKGTAIANELSMGRAVLAVALPVVVVALLVLLVAIPVVALILVAVAGGG